MVTKVHFCVKCSRPINHSGYCSDCSAEFAAGISNRCTFCGKSTLLSPLAFNKTTKKVYCKDCLNVFVQGLRGSSMPEHEIKKIIDRDFLPVR